MKFVSNKLQHYWKLARDYCVYNVLHADDPPHKLALGIAVGMFVTFTPLIGFQMVMNMFLAWLLRANKFVGIPLVWISNPFTIVPIYYPCYWIGCKLINVPVIGDEWWEQLTSRWEDFQLDGTVTWFEKVSFWWSSLLQIATPLWVGCVVVGLSAGISSYYGSLLAIRRYRLKRWGQLMPPRVTPDDHQTASQPSPPPEDSSSSGSV
jgi:uncharacterized protein